MNRVNCILLEKEIDEGTCFDISMVAEHLAPKSTMPQEVLLINNYEGICLNCPHHRND